MNYDGKRYKVDDIVGVFEKDPWGDIMLQSPKKGVYKDSKGRLVNKKGYLIDSKGNIIDQSGREIWKKE